MTETSRLPVRIAAGAAAALLALLPLALRGLHLSEGGYDPVSADRWGFLGDLATGVGVVALIVVLRSWSRIAAAALAILWVCLNFGWYEFLREFGSHYFLVHSLYITDPTFLKGSAAAMAHPLPAALMLAAAALAAWSVGRLRRAYRPVAAGAGLALIALPAALPLEYNQPLWRLQNFLLPNLTDVAGRLIHTSGSLEALAGDDPELGAVFSPDLSGTPLFEFPAGRPRNVLLVMIEGVAGGSLPSLAERHGVTSKVAFDGLDRLARDNLSYSTFLTHQRQTNRGEYSLLCGDFPKLGTAIPKMAEIANGRPKRCLPQVLRDHGYATLYIQSANLSFMFKDKFMPKVGFDASHGEDWFDPKYPWGGWGVDDRALYESALPEIEALDGGEKPWFVSLMTSGTHHPFHFPADYDGFPDAGREFRAMQFADVAVTEFVDRLRERGLLDDTLVLITSDEASFVHETGTPKEEALAAFTANWGFMVAMTPEKARARIDKPVQQADVTLSVLDYLGLRDEAGPFLGRSLFRDYAEPRPIFFANLYNRMTGVYRDGGGLDLCAEDLASCTGYDVPEGRLFSADVKRSSKTEASSLLRGVQAKSLRPAQPEPAASAAF